MPIVVTIMLRKAQKGEPMRRDVEFTVEEGVTLRGWLYVPNGQDGPHPTIVMAPDFAQTRDCYLTEFAGVLSEEGYAVLLYDHRNLGDSDGLPRGDISPWQQISDYRAAVDWAAGLAEVDEERIAVWGTGYSGGHVIAVGATDRRVRCVISHIPIVSGSDAVDRMVRPESVESLRHAYGEDEVRGSETGEGDRPATTVLVPVGFAGSTVLECLPGEASALAPAGGGEASRAFRYPEVTLRSLLEFGQYDPVSYLPLISPTPLLMIIAAEDHVTPDEIATRGFDTAGEPKRLEVMKCGRDAAASGGPAAHARAEALDWLSVHMQPKSRMPGRQSQGRR